MRKSIFKNIVGVRFNKLVVTGFAGRTKFGEILWHCFFNRKRKLEIITGFSDGFFDSYEEDDEGGIWKTITTAWFPSVTELKKAMNKMKKYSWLFLSDSSILFNGKEIYCNGRWIDLK